VVGGTMRKGSRFPLAAAPLAKGPRAGLDGWSGMGGEGSGYQFGLWA